MLEYLWVVPLLPLLGFATLTLAGGALGVRGRAIVGVGSTGLTAALSIAMASVFLASGQEAFGEVLWRWISIGNFTPAFGLYLDPVSLCWMLITSVVGFLIHLYSSHAMEADSGHRRYFAYLNLFVGAMLLLVLGKNLLVLFLGWEGVGLCSYLLIGHWFQEHDNVMAARKSFIVTRVGNAALMAAMFLLFTQLGTLDIQPMVHQANSQWATGSAVANIAAVLILLGAVGKSAQLPLQTWLLDAMAGPSPVSALIHAATMVTAGVYLIARLHVLYALAPAVQTTVAVIGLATLLLSATSALTQNDIKRILAYSTISQIGYMFLALGAGAWSASVFHFMSHAFFKALLFMASGSILLALNDEHDIHRMGDIRRRMPWVFWPFLAGSLSLAALPLVTAAFYSKGLILSGAFKAPGGHWLWAGAILGALLTAIYTFRMFYTAFLGEAHGQVAQQPDWRAKTTFATLGFLALAGGFIGIPAYLGGFEPLIDFLRTALPDAPGRLGEPTEVLLELLAAFAAILGIALAWRWYRPGSKAMKPETFDRGVATFWFNGWGFDALYEFLFRQPYDRLSHTGRNDWIRGVPTGARRLCELGNRVLVVSQTGQIRWYVAGLGTGAVILTGIVLLT